MSIRMWERFQVRVLLMGFGMWIFLFVIKMIYLDIFFKKRNKETGLHLMGWLIYFGKLLWACICSNIEITVPYIWVYPRMMATSTILQFIYDLDLLLLYVLFHSVQSMMSLNFSFTNDNVQLFYIYRRVSLICFPYNFSPFLRYNN